MKRFTTLTISLFLLLILIAISIRIHNGATQSAGQSSTSQEQTSNKLQDRSRADESSEFIREGPQGPPGLWSVAATADATQIDDPRVPVALLSTSSMAGKGRWVNLIVSRATMENRSFKPVKNVQLKWILKLIENGTAAILQGTTRDFEVQLPATTAQQKRIPFINFSKIARSLLKNGELNGEYLLVISVESVEFEDGTTWKQQQEFGFKNPSVAPSKTAKNQKETRELRAHTNSPKPQASCPNELCSVGPIFGEAQCWLQPSSAGSACTKHSCNGIFCICDNIPCNANCPDADGDGWTVCEGDCNDDPMTGKRINPGQLEYLPIGNCSDGVDNDCDLSTEKDCRDFTCKNIAKACATPTPTPTPTSTCGPCPSHPGYAEFNDEHCTTGVSHWSCTLCRCIRNSPILIDVLGNGFALTDAARGVSFNFSGSGAVRLSWTVFGSDDAFLVLDRNANGIIDDGTELFGNLTPQPAPLPGQEPNGFLALAEYDELSNGGNGDGVITQSDAVFNSLRLWQDANHNGVSEPSELHNLGQLGITALELDYKESKRVDQYGNQFRYRAKVKDTSGAQLGRWAWDVFLISVP